MAEARARRIRAAAGAGLGIALAVLGYLLLRPLLPVPARDPLRHAAALLVLPAALVFAQVAATMLVRAAAGAFDPLSDPEPRALRLSQRVLSNTVEQAAIFCPALLAAGAAGLPGPALSAAALLWTGARLLFWAGYLLDPLWRAPGMAATATVAGGLIAATAAALVL